MLAMTVIRTLQIHSYYSDSYSPLILHLTLCTGQNSTIFI